MNAYQVIWQPRQWKKLQQMSDSAANPAAIDQAVLKIVGALGSDPHRNGIALSEGLWKFESYPLRVFYSINSPRHRVIIRQVDHIL